MRIILTIFLEIIILFRTPGIVNGANHDVQQFNKHVNHNNNRHIQIFNHENDITDSIPPIKSASSFLKRMKRSSLQNAGVSSSRENSMNSNHLMSGPSASSSSASSASSSSSSSVPSSSLSSGYHQTISGQSLLGANDNDKLLRPEKCIPIEIPLCKNIGYNLTYMPNAFNHETQEEAGLEVSSLYLFV
uniref:FZ domain-containing protein n=1 Tax=Trichobilharzia regenti TaxID=157069 RepID=A0AA85J6V7_TRIRE|nr:unnamed protein product [Trichobilharzia regenti]